MQIDPILIHSSEFLFSENVFIAEASGLGDTCNYAVEEGFTIVSEKTGKEAIFELAMVKSEEMDILSWNFICTTTGLGYLKAVIFND
jgi:hypothetical protein